MLYLLTLIAPHFLAFFLIVYKISRLTPTDIHLPPKIGVSHLHIFEEGVFCRKMINLRVQFVQNQKNSSINCLETYGIKFESAGNLQSIVFFIHKLCL
ncbi:hypothetical protein EXW28_29255 (plasmid) [Bacillus mycoides]|nr:hypothetical protein DN409_28970 [Bacillus mycoides]QWG53821.1 hypothetical protein EXW37_29250 [Bacillus mycoides]QWG59342.1 hypothetical protein EXW26_29010 [Bacillus mycoides]QWG75937.1 hypothetical protein EXW63_28490 [Bacillus mycoides]QWH26319.1 hypothetical protein EXW50_28915 [Bacillus mycoides]